MSLDPLEALARLEQTEHPEAVDPLEKARTITEGLLEQTPTREGDERIATTLALIATADALRDILAALTPPTPSQAATEAHSAPETPVEHPDEREWPPYDR